MLSQEGLELAGVSVGAKHSEAGHDRGHQAESRYPSKGAIVGRFPVTAAQEDALKTVGGLDVFV